jgi:hypothetical protein
MSTYDPIREFQQIRRDLQRLLREGTGEVGAGPTRFRAAFLPGSAARQYPLVNYIYQDGDDFHVEALAPGLDPAGIEVSAVRNTLTIRGKKPGLRDVAPEDVGPAKPMTLEQRVRELEAAVERLGTALTHLNQEHDSWCKYRRLLERYGQGELAAAVTPLETRLGERCLRVAVRDLILQLDQDLGEPQHGPLADLRRRIRTLVRCG